MHFQHAPISWYRSRQIINPEKRSHLYYIIYNERNIHTVYKYPCSSKWTHVHPHKCTFSISISHFHLCISSSLFYLFLHLFNPYPSLSLYLLVSRSGKKERGRGRERKGVGLADLVLAIRVWSAALRGGRGVQACCGRNSVMNTYARVKWWLLICSIRNIWRPMKCRIEQRAAERYDRQELWAPTQSPAVSI